MQPPKIKTFSSKTAKKSIITTDKEIAPENVSGSILTDIVNNSSFLLSGIHIKDINEAFVEMAKEQFNFKIDGKDVPIYSYTHERFTEIMEHYDNVDKNNNIVMPFISIIRDTIPMKGTSLGETYNIPTDARYTLFEETVLKNGEKYKELYRIPQPVTVDLKYTIGIYTTTLQDIDVFSEKMLFTFSKLQQNLKVKGHNMSVILDDERDESENELEKRRYYKHEYTLKVKGYIINEEEFEVVRGLNKINLPIALSDTKLRCCHSFNQVNTHILDGNDCNTILTINFKPKQSNIYNIDFETDYKFISTNHQNATFKLNDVDVSLPFDVNIGDNLKITHSYSIYKKLKIKIYSFTNS
jgi:hypothetical protein